MSRYPREARTAAVKCISCAAPAAETIAGTYVCVECGQSVVRRKPASADGALPVQPPGDSARGDPAYRADGFAAGPAHEVAGSDDRRTERSRTSHRPTTDGGVVESRPGQQVRDRTALAVGVVASVGHSDPLLRTVVRARARGHEVLLTDADALEPEVRRLARSLGATVVDQAEGLDEDALRASLEAAGRTMSVRGVIVQPAPYPRIDYERSEAALDPESYVTDAISEPPEQSQEVVAAIPARNEAARIGGIVETAARYADEVLVVDDGSDDDTAALAEAAGATVVRHGRNLGYGAALKTAFSEAEARAVDRLVVLDGDGQHDANDIPTLLDAMDGSDADVVIGSRFVDGSETDVPRYRRFGISVINVLLNASVGAVRPSASIKDTQSGFRVYDSGVVELLADARGISDDMEASVDILYLARTNGFRIEEVGVTVDYSVESPNSRNPVSHGFGIVRTLVRTIERDRPLATLGLPGLVCLAAGLGLVISLLGGGVAASSGPAVAIAASVFLAFGTVASFAAAVLHGFNLNRHYFER